MSSSWTSINQPPTPSPSPPHSNSPSVTETDAMSNLAPSPTSGDSQAEGQKKKRTPLPNHPQRKTLENDLEKEVPTSNTSILTSSSAPSTSITPPPAVAATNAAVTASTTTSQDSPAWAHKYEPGHLGDLSVPLEAGELVDYSNHFKGNGKKDCPSYPGKHKKPSWPYVAYVLLASVPGGNMRVDVVYRMGIEWIPEMAKLDKHGNPSHDNQSCRAALSRGGGGDLFISYNINKIDYWRLANRGEARPEPRNNGGRKKRKAEDENVQDQVGKSSSRAEQPAAKKKAARKIRLILQGKREDVEAPKPQALNVPKQNRPFSEVRDESDIWPHAPFSMSSHQVQDDLPEYLDPVTPQETMCNPGEDIQNNAQQPANILSLISVHEKKPRDMANVLSPQELSNTPIGNLLAENNVDQILRASPSEYENLQLREGHPGVAVGPHPYGTPGALPDADAARQQIAERVDMIVDVSNDERQTTNSYVTSSESDPNEWVTKAVNILVQRKRDNRNHNLEE